MKKGKYERAIGYQSVENTTHAQSGARDTCYRSSRIAVSLRYKVARENRSTNRRCNIGLSKVVTWTPLNGIVVQSYNANTNKAIGDSRLRRRMRNLAATSGESRWISRYVADSKLASVFDRLRENMTSSTKPEVHDLLHCRHRRTEPQRRATRTENFVKFERVVFETCKLKNSQTHTDTLNAMFYTPPDDEVYIGAY